MRKPRLAVTAAAIIVTAALAGCSAGSTNAAAPTGAAAVTPTPTAAQTTNATTAPPASTKQPTAAPVSSWPSPEDCISYDPNKVTVQYEAGIYAITDGSKTVMRLQGGPGEPTIGDKGLALAQRYRRHCFLGRDNARQESASYIFDYWRDPSGKTPTIPGQEDDCSPYNRNNLTVEDMGGGDGWRVKDHDHVLQLFDNGTDARNGKLVLAKYSQICFIGDPADDTMGQDQVDYLLS